MSITSRVIASGELFLATTDFGDNEGNWRDAHTPINPDHIYGGNLLPSSYFVTTQNVVFTGAMSAVFKGNELEEVFHDIRLIPYR